MQEKVLNFLGAVVIQGVVLQGIYKESVHLIVNNKKVARTLLSNLSNGHITKARQVSNITTSNGRRIIIKSK